MTRSKFTKPFAMDYIYTIEKYRNMGHAQTLINQLTQSTNSRHVVIQICQRWYLTNMD